ncbi:NifB/NifX family molybdenum-iron cluster-binding protein [Clostridium senegalense]|uniref:Diguanylate cyclase n=1 Tax=Clostridium senegalense TaxID=1465809 RepID=A0A6M0H7B1_9CLOT|nr:NifB/NifX family molybdenum-iron cluster-binding protein [Clostridium senegalense]NEU05903.1 diguanylate cyclase [Clostridium senegalense]
MKIAISANGKESNSLVDARFGRCDLFQIHDGEKKQFYVLDNEGKSSSGGAGIVAAQQLINENVDYIITGNLGPNAFKLIEKAKIKAFKSDVIFIEDALKMLEKDELEEISFAGPEHGGMGNGHMGGR